MMKNEEFEISRMRENIKKCKLSNTSEYLMDIYNIENSYTGRVTEVMNMNIFILEATQLLVNSISLFEMGYFDAAYYSLRQSIEMCLVLIYFAELSEKDKKKADRVLKMWNKNKWFPMRKGIVDNLSKIGLVFSDMKEKMKHFFENVDNLSKRLNKYLHKQGFKYFYLTRRFYDKSAQNISISNFEHFLRQSIGVVAVMRLAIDPYPLLLNDKEILYRCYDSITEPYSTNFIKKYIDEIDIKDYMKTEIYKGYYEYHIKQPKKNMATFNVMKNHYIEINKKEDILKQFELLSNEEKISCCIVFSIEKVNRIYWYKGLLVFFTDRNDSIILKYDYKEFEKYENSKELYNQEYKNEYMSVFKYKIYNRIETVWVEHNEKLTDDEIQKLENMV